MIAVNHHPSRSQLGVFAAACLVAGGVAAWRMRMHGHVVGAEVAAAAAVGAPVLWAISAEGIRRVYVVMCYAAYPAGWLVFQVVMAVIYWGVVTPVGWALRCAGRDGLNRRFEPKQATYWVERKQRQPEDYFSQY